MTFARWEHSVTDEYGNLIPNVTVEVRRETSNQMANPIYQDAEGLTVEDNPLFAADGHPAFHAAGGFYRISISAPGIETIELRYVAIGNAQATDVDSLQEAGFKFSPESTITAPPSVGCVRGNNADLAAATHIYVSVTTASGSDVETWLTALDPGTKLNKNGLLLSTSNGEEAYWAVDDALLVVDAAGDYVDFTVSGYQGPTTLAFIDSGYVSIAREITGNDAGGGTVEEMTTAGPFTVGNATSAFVLKKAAPSATAIALPAVAVRNGIALVISDYNMNAGDITITPNGSEKIMNQSTWIVGSGGSIRLTPVTGGWIIG